VDLIKEERFPEPLGANPSFVPDRKPRTDLSSLSLADRARLISERPDYGRPLCRCEDVTEGEVRDALRSPLGVCSLDSVKRRTRVCAGRCHGGFCMPRILGIIHEETRLPLEKIRKKAGRSFLVVGRTKEREGIHA
jgi:glycerol-3-phosphate dehydrogenase